MKTNTFLIFAVLTAYWVGLCNARAFYDPGAQRWLNRDPIAEIGFESLRGKGPSHKTDPNLYEFVRNNPINFDDLFGLTVNNPPPCAPYPDCDYPHPPAPPPPPTPLAPPCDPTAKDPYGCWAQTKPPGLPQPGGPVGGIACEARQYGCLQCCEDKFPINGGSSADYLNCTQSCEDNYKRCIALKK